MIIKDARCFAKENLQALCDFSQKTLTFKWYLCCMIIFLKSPIRQLHEKNVTLFSHNSEIIFFFTFLSTNRKKRQLLKEYITCVTWSLQACYPVIFERIMDSRVESDRTPVLGENGDSLRITNEGSLDNEGINGHISYDIDTSSTW